MLKFISKLFGGSKSEKDVQAIMPIIQKVGAYYQELQGLSNDALRAKTVEFKERIKTHLKTIDDVIAEKNARYTWA
jgi:preprotein translocase subunit SecA